jgi:hypothetical protein
VVPSVLRCTVGIHVLRLFRHISSISNSVGEKVLENLLAERVGFSINELTSSTHKAGNIEPSALNCGLINVHVSVTRLAAHRNSLDSFRLQPAFLDHLRSGLATSCTCHKEGL